MDKFFLGILIGSLTFAVVNTIVPEPIKSDHPLTPHKEIKVDANGDSTITYIYKLDSNG